MFDARFLVGTSVVGLFAAGVSAAGSLVGWGDSLRSGWALALAGGSLLPLLLVRFGAGVRALLALQVALLGCLLTFNALLHAQLDWFSLLYLALLPVLALLGLGARAAVFTWVLCLLVTVGIAVEQTVGLRFELGDVVLRSVAGDVAAWVMFSSTVSSFAFLFHLLRVRAVAEAERSERARGLFLANISHELRTPMNGVVGMTDLLTRSELSVVQRDQVDVIRRSGEALVTLINDLLDYTKLESGNVKLERRPLVPALLLADTLSLFRPLATKKDVLLDGRLDGQVPEALLGDPLRLKQILQNLVSNAVKFTPRGRVDVALAYESGSLVMRVVDQGIGIGEDTARVLFRPFTQGDVSTTRRYGGTGLGLAICYQLATQMRGAIALESKKGQGTCFKVTVPMEPCAPPLEEEPSGKHRRSELAGGVRPRVLIAEDNHINQVVLSAMLAREGYTCHVVENGQAAVDALTREAFAIVLMDCQMPVMDGYEATQCIRQLATPAATTPVVAVTASAMGEDVERCLAAGMDAVVTKPVTLTALREVLGRVLGTKT
jgi:signal transduction histidine kinase/CheY-like chemotaxis protein